MGADRVRRYQPQSGRAGAQGGRRVEDFFRAVHEGRPPAVTGEEAAEVNRVIAAVYGD